MPGGTTGSGDEARPRRRARAGPGPRRRRARDPRARRRRRGLRRSGGRGARGHRERRHRRRPVRPGRRAELVLRGGYDGSATPSSILVLFNPYGDDAIVDVTFLTDAGVQAPEAFQGLVVPRRSRVSLPIADEVRRQDHVADRSCTPGPAASWPSAASSSTGRPVASGSPFRSGRPHPPGSGRCRSASSQAGRRSSPWPSRTSRLLPTDVEVDVLIEGSRGDATRDVQVPGRSVTFVDVGRQGAGRRQLHRRRAGDPRHADRRRDLLHPDGTGGGHRGAAPRSERPRRRAPGRSRSDDPTPTATPASSPTTRDRSR